jgi:hypothetical protein
MNTMIVANITYIDEKQNLQLWKEKITGKDLKDIKNQLREKFGKAKKQPEYTDIKPARDGQDYYQSGWVFHFWDKYSDTGKRFPTSAWVTLSQLLPVEIVNGKRLVAAPFFGGI